LPTFCRTGDGTKTADMAPLEDSEFSVSLPAAVEQLFPKGPRPQLCTRDRARGAKLRLFVYALPWAYHGQVRLSLILTRTRTRTRTQP
jgi:hypothetical protein